jgi:hypothetical protein
MKTSIIPFLLLMPIAYASILRGSEQDNGNFISRLLGATQRPTSRLTVPTAQAKTPTRRPTSRPTVPTAQAKTPTPRPTSRPTVPGAQAKTCPKLDSGSFQVLPKVKKCSTNADCEGVMDITGFSSTCCIHPLCVCSPPDSKNPNLTCVDDSVNRNDGMGLEIDIGRPVSPTKAPTKKPTRPPSPSNTCPSPQAHIYQAYPGVTPCTTNADCAGFTSPDGPTCCVHPMCICGVSNLGASGKMQCVATRRDRELFELDFGENLP